MNITDLNATLDACQARIDFLRQVVAAEPEFAKWGPVNVTRDLYLVHLWPIGSMTTEEILTSAQRIAKALGGKWRSDGGKWWNDRDGFIIYADPMRVIRGTETDSAYFEPFAEDAALVAPLVVNR
jgi:hypothetical protein